MDGMGKGKGKKEREGGDVRASVGEGHEPWLESVFGGPDDGGDAGAEG